MHIKIHYLQKHKFVVDTNWYATCFYKSDAAQNHLTKLIFFVILYTVGPKDIYS